MATSMEMSTLIEIPPNDPEVEPRPRSLAARPKPRGRPIRLRPPSQPRQIYSPRGQFAGMEAANLHVNVPVWTSIAAEVHNNRQVIKSLLVTLVALFFFMCLVAGYLVHHLWTHT